MARRTTSIKVDEELWKEFKKRAIDKDLEISEYLERLMRKELGR
jgi:hypothetical protein